MITVLEQPIPFGGGIALPANKAISLQEPLAPIFLPKLLTLPLQQHLGMPAVPIVKAGDRVFKGQKIAQAKGFISAAVHASSSGTVREISQQDIPASTKESSLSIVIETDGKDEWLPEREAVSDYLQASQIDLQQRIMQAGIVGMGGAGFPSSVKLIPGLSLDIELLIINAAECDPYISCDESVIRNYTEDFLTGVDILAHALQVDACVIAIKESNTEAIEILKQALEKRPDCDIQIKQISSLYPAGGEKQLIKSITGVAVPTDGLPVDIGVVCYNVGTAYAVKKAILDAEPLISRVVTVTGPGIEKPCNREVLIGTPINEVIQECGGYNEQYQYLIMGGPMMGVRLLSDQVPVLKTTHCLLAAGEEQLANQKPEMPCIRCDDCATVCPAGLQPQQLHWHSKVFNAERLQDYRLFDCIECGCCSYVCPSHIPLVDRYKLAKARIWDDRRRHLESGQNRQRYEDKLERQQRREHEKQSRRKKHSTTVEADNQQGELQQKQAEIAAAVQRVKSKRQQKQDSS